jgi:hypothetical protein
MPSRFGFGRGTTLEQEVESTPALSHGDGDHERFAHYVRKGKIVESALTGGALRALCGKVWVPSRDPQKFPICPTCKEIHDGLRPGPDDGKSDSGK